MFLPSVSVIIPCHNRERTIARAVDSVLDQRLPNVEVIVIDDGSSDGSIDVLTKYGTRILWETGPNRGACYARNRGLALTNCEYVFFLDSDDWYVGEILQELPKLAHENQLDIALGWHFLQSSSGRRSVKPYESGTNSDEVYKTWGPDCITQIGSVCWRRDFIVGIHGWREGLHQWQDIEIIYRALMHSAKLSVFDVSGVVYNNHSDETRISTVIGERKIASIIEAIAELAEQAKEKSIRDRHAIGMLCYRAARHAFRYKHISYGRAALRLARQLGFTGHIGTNSHTFLAALVGLELKELLVGFRTKKMLENPFEPNTKI